MAALEADAVWTADGLRPPGFRGIPDWCPREVIVDARVRPSETGVADCNVRFS
jgi:hypothetical protein